MTPQLRTVFDQHRNERAAELFEIAELLVDAGLISDAEPIQLAAGQCRSAIKAASASQPDAGKQYWGYEISGLRINLEVQRHMRPRSAVMDKSSTGILSVKVQEYAPENETEVGDSFTLLRRLDTNFCLDVYHVVEGERHPLRAAWHIDTHIDTATTTHSVHPRFHFQVGGEDLDQLDASIRGVFMPETPRMPCAPLDAILAVDFILSHYCGSNWIALRDIEPRYGRVRKNPMQRYWSPYFRTLADGIDDLDTSPNGGLARSLVPNIFSS